MEELFIQVIAGNDASPELEKGHQCLSMAYGFMVGMSCEKNPDMGTVVEKGVSPTVFSEQQMGPLPSLPKAKLPRRRPYPC